MNHMGMVKTRRETVHTPTPVIKTEIIRFEPAISLYEEQLKKQEEIDKQHNAMLEKLNADYREQIHKLNNEKLEIEEKKIEIERELELRSNEVNAKQAVDKVQEQVLKNTVKIRSLRKGQLELKEKEKWERLSSRQSVMSKGGRTSSGLEKK